MLKTIFSLLIVVLFSTNAFAITAMAGGAKTDEKALAKAEEAANKMHEKQYYERIGAELGFFKEARTGICFAVFPGVGYGPSITTVPCEKIPPSLLVR